VNKELEKLWKEVVMAYLMHLPKGTKENHETLSSDSQFLYQDLKLESAKYKGVLTA
jgi:hypothetical protein